MSEIQKVKSLEVGQDLNFQTLMWKIQRVGWFFMAALLVAGLLGLLGNGVLSESSASSANDLSIEYERYVRRMAPSQLVLAVKATNSDSSKVYFDREFIEGIQIEQITPIPSNVVTTDKYYIYSFPIQQPTSESKVFIHYKPQQMGWLKGQIGLTEDNLTSFDQLVYP